SDDGAGGEEPEGRGCTGVLAENALQGGAGREAAASKKQDGGEEHVFRVGDRVEHKKFGRGRITETRIGPTGDLEVFVSFDTVGVKHLLVKYAPLQKI
ncbi:MAG: hypothetical protein ACPLTR_06200, partial [Thermacetogeniaceae bacterium]